MYIYICSCTCPMCSRGSMTSADSCLLEKHSRWFAWIEAGHVPIGPFLQYVRVNQRIL